MLTLPNRIIPSRAERSIVRSQPADCLLSFNCCFLVFRTCFRVLLDKVSATLRRHRRIRRQSKHSASCSAQSFGKDYLSCGRTRGLSSSVCRDSRSWIDSTVCCTLAFMPSLHALTSSACACARHDTRRHQQHEGRTATTEEEHTGSLRTDTMCEEEEEEAAGKALR